MKRIVGDRHRDTVYLRAEYLRFTNYLSIFDGFRFGILKI